MRTLIIGCGNKGALADIPRGLNAHKYLSYAHAAKTFCCNLAFMDIQESKASNAVEIWGGAVIGFEQHSTSLKYDIVVVATNDEYHIQSLYKALEFNPRLVICEKPVCTFEQLEDGKKIVAEYQNQNIPMLVNYTRRYCYEWNYHKEQIDAGDYGAFVRGYLFFNGGWEHTCSHFVDFVRFLGLDMSKIRIEEVPVGFKWVFQWGLIFESDTISESITKNSINKIYNWNTFDVFNNATDHLRTGAKLICSGAEALKSLIKTKDWGEAL